jgi:DNA-binding SARP family transcriptional activator/Tfp pilus assembly protein PilF
MFILRTFGTLDLRRPDNRPIAGLLAQPKRMGLLVFLAAAEQSQANMRDTLLAMFWPEMPAPRARRALNQALYELRKALGPDAIVSQGDQGISIERARLCCDAAAFRSAIDDGVLVDAMSLYRGEFLAGFFVSGVPAFERWQEGQRDQFRRSASAAAARLSDLSLSEGKSEEAVHWARWHLEIARHDERALRHLMNLLAQSGNPAEAIEAYGAFARNLAADLEIEPSAESTRLLQEIRRSKVLNVSASESSPRDIPPVVAPGLDSRAIGLRTASPWARARRPLAMMSVCATALLVAHLGFERTNAIDKNNASPAAETRADYYTRLGRFYWDRRTEKSLVTASMFFRRAIAEDARYAPAFSGLADTYTLMSWYGGAESSVAGREAMSAASTAVRMNDKLAQSHASLAAARAWFANDWPGAEREYRRAIQLDSTYATAHEWFALGLAAQGALPAARRELEIARAREPASPAIRTDLGIVLIWSGQYDDAINQLQIALALDSSYARAATQLWRADAAAGHFQSAFESLIRATRLQGGNPAQLRALERAYTKSGWPGALTARLAILLDSPPGTSAVQLAAVCGLLGRDEEAIAWLQRARRERSTYLRFVSLDPAFKHLHTDPRFREIASTS